MSNLPATPIPADGNLGLTVHDAIAARRGETAGKNPFLEEAYDASDELALAASTEYERLETTVYIKKQTGETVTFSGGAVKRERQGTYNKKSLTSTDYKYLRPLALVGFADVARLRFLHTTSQSTILEPLTEQEMLQKKSAGAKRDLTVRRTVVKDTGKTVLVQEKTVYRTMMKLQEMGLVEQVKFDSGAVWQITEAGLKKVGDPLNLKAKAQRIDARTINPNLVSSHLATVHVMFGLLSPDPFMRNAMGLQALGTPDLSDLITEKQVLKWWGEWDTRMNQEFKADKELKPAFGNWRKQRLAELVQEVKHQGLLEWSELLAHEPALWVQGQGGLSLAEVGASSVAARRFVDLIWSREGERVNQLHKSIGFEVETTAESAASYERWLHTFAAEFELQGGPYGVMVVALPASPVGKSIASSFKKAEFSRCMAKARAAGMVPKDKQPTKAEALAAIEAFGILGKTVKLVTMVFPDGSGYDPRAPRQRQ